MRRRRASTRTGLLRLRGEMLEQRRQLAAVFWDGGAGTSNWGDANNWSGNALPAAADDVTISVPGTITVNLAVLATVRSLNCSENLAVGSGSLTVTSGASTISGTLTATGGTFHAMGAGTTLTATGATAISAASLLATGGAVLALPNLAAFSHATSVPAWAADGPGSRLELPALTSLTSTDSNFWLIVSGSSGGVVSIPNLAATTAASVQILATGAGGRVELPALATWTDNPGGGPLSSFQVNNGGTLTVGPALAALDGVRVLLGPAGWTFPVGQLVSVKGGGITADGAPAPFTALSNADHSALVARSGAVLSLPSLNTYTHDNLPTWAADGPGSRLELPALGAIASPHPTHELSIVGQNGGVVALPALAVLPSARLQLLSTGPGTRIELPVLAAWSDPPGGGPTSRVRSELGGLVQLTAQTLTVSGVVVQLAPTGSIQGGTLALVGASQLVGTGTLGMHLVNEALVSPGASPGALAVAGNFTQTAAGTLALEINGAAPGTLFDQITVQGSVSLAGALDLSSTAGPPGPPAGTSLTLIDNDLADGISGIFAALPEGSFWTLNDVPYRLSYAGGDGNDLVAVRANGLADRRLFYNNSAWDNNQPAANPNDDAALALDKVALLPAGTATFANYTSFSKGINGLFVDVAQLPGDGAAISAADFSFRVGNNNNVASWGPAPGPVAVSVRPEAGMGGSDRVSLTWPDGTITKKWLQVTVLSTANTGLATAEVFYFGNAVGESGDTTTNAAVNATDEIGARANPRSALVNPAPIDFRWDYNRDKAVNSTDQLIARTNTTTLADRLVLIAPPPSGGGGALADAAAWGGGGLVEVSPGPRARRKL
jgi:hypothetical protein